MMPRRRSAIENSRLRRNVIPRPREAATSRAGLNIVDCRPSIRFRGGAVVRWFECPALCRIFILGTSQKKSAVSELGGDRSDRLRTRS